MRRKRSGRAAWAVWRFLRGPIACRRFCLVDSRGFTLIELLVVVSIVSLLLALLLPTLQRVRKQAGALRCQANLHQWATFYETALAENNGEWAKGRNLYDGGVESTILGWGPWGGWFSGESSDRDYQMYKQVRGILRCPLATRFIDPGGAINGVGGTFMAWSFMRSAPSCEYDRGSYGVNPSVYGFAWPPDEQKAEPWNAAGVRHGDRIPVYLDSCYSWSQLAENWPPPSRDAIPTRVTWENGDSCINRHEGCVNGMFWDASVRRIGLKELWTLRWRKDSMTIGPWTRAGGVQPEDWPLWMRGFKDY